MTASSDAVLSVVYPFSPGARFDIDYYRDIHLPMVRRSLSDAGLLEASAVIGVAALDGAPAPYAAISRLRFSDVEQIKAGLAGPAGAALIGDVANFTDITPTIQISALA